MEKGIPVSDGIVIEQVLVYKQSKIDIPTTVITNPKQELQKLQTAIDESVSELNLMRSKVLEELDEEHAMIFDAHIMIAKDIEIWNQAKDKIEEELVNPAYAYSIVTDGFIEIFNDMDDTYFKERIADIKDVRKRVLSHLLNIPITDLSNLKEDSIIVAEDLSPSDTASLNLSRTKGFITSVGGRTSHTAIMARSLGIPAVVGVRDIDKKVNDGDLVIMDAISGDVVINPDKLQVKTYQKKIEDLKKLNSKYEPYINAETLSKDGHILEFSANIGSIDDVNQNLSETSDGIGLFRTEFLYMNQDHLPTEEEQYKAYKAVLERMGNKKVIIRTLDIGGDKHLEYLELDEEMNPFLGHRALRLCLSNKDLFKTQLRALLKASVYGNLHIMFPMVATLGELREAKALLEECESELTNENSNFSKDYKIGIMIEIPAAALLADQFAKEVDFFSIGTNDLIQYTFAADRMNQSVSYLYQPYNPSLLRLIKMVIDASHKEGIWTGMCGEMAGDVYALPVLFGLGLDEFSMAASSIKKLRYYLSHLSKEECKAIAEHSLALSSNEEVQEYIIKTIGDIV